LIISTILSNYPYLLEIIIVKQTNIINFMLLQ